MSDLVNILRRIETEAGGSGLRFSLSPTSLDLRAGVKTHHLKTIRLFRPSAEEILRTGAPDNILIISDPSGRAAKAASQFNHILIPSGGYRLVVPGVAMIHEAPPLARSIHGGAKLSGRTGVIAETLLLGNRPAWSVQDLAAAAKTSPALAHRVLVRLERENILMARGAGPTKERVLTNHATLAEIWADEEQPARVCFRGYIYGATPEAIAARVLSACPNAAIGDAFAANLYNPILTRAPLPIRLWVPEELPIESITRAGLQEANEGPNFELLLAKGNPWSIHRANGDLPKVSNWRAWVEVSKAAGRTKELADTLFAKLIGGK